MALLHNRLTHSLKVGQVGRKIAATLNYLASPTTDTGGKIRSAYLQFGGANAKDHADRAEAVDPWVLETAGMVHDLGHPPFGHVAEATLNKLLSTKPNTSPSGQLYPQVSPGYDLPDGFEGNAQTFRIVTRLAFGRLGTSKIKVGGPGLNLTRASLSGVSKYPGCARLRLRASQMTRRSGVHTIAKMTFSDGA